MMIEKGSVLFGFRERCQTELCRKVKVREGGGIRFSVQTYNPVFGPGPVNLAAKYGFMTSVIRFFYTDIYVVCTGRLFL